MTPRLILIGALSVSLAALGISREIDPARFSGTDQERLEKAFDAWSREPGSTLRLDKRSWTVSQTISVGPPFGSDRVSGRIVGSRFWRNVVYVGPAGRSAFEFRNAKDVSLTGLSVVGSGVSFLTDSSSSRLALSECRVEGTGVGSGYLFEADAGSNGDISVVSLRDCEAKGFASGFRWVGPNNLDPFVSHCIASECGIGFDLREGGSNALLLGVSGTLTKELVVVNGGYQADVLVQSAEHCGTVFRTGGDDAGGFGQPVPQYFKAFSMRDGTGPWAVINKCGEVSLEVASIKGPDRVRYENRSESPLALVLTGAAKKSLVIGTGVRVD